MASNNEVSEVIRERICLKESSGKLYLLELAKIQLMKEHNEALFFLDNIEDVGIWWITKRNSEGHNKCFHRGKWYFISEEKYKIL